MSKEYNIERFIEPQNSDYPTALREIQNGRKVSHWIWYIFPQLRALGYSSMAVYYGIEDLDEARAYLAHPVLNARLREITEALTTLEESDPYRVMGRPDDMKLRSCMTLFAEATEDNAVFLKVLDKFYNGEKDGRTLRLLSGK